MLPYSYSRSHGFIFYVWQQFCQYWHMVRQTLSPAVSADYLQWRHEFLYKRLGYGLWIGLVCFLISSAHGLYLFIVEIEQLRTDLDKIFEEPLLAEQLRSITVIGFCVINSLLILCLIIHRSPWGHRYPAFIFLLFSGAVNGFITQIIATFFDVPVSPSPIIFLAFAVLVPLRWPLHLASQLLPIIYYVVVLPILGLTEIGNTPIYDSIYSLGTFIQIAWVCLICNTGVFVCERLRRSEFESQRELQIFLHAVSHDLRNPVIGSSMVIKNLLNQTTDGQVILHAPVLERLLQGSDRQLKLINSLVEAHHADAQGLLLQVQPLQVSTVVSGVLADIEPKLVQNRVNVINTLDSELPFVNADSTHLWRVFSNLIENALKHNPPGIQLVLEAEVLPSRSYASRFSNGSSGLGNSLNCVKTTNSRSRSQPMLLCRIKDNGVGISYSQCQRLFELYTRGKRARYMPGLGLGLYLCKQIITAHGGDIGVLSQLSTGSTFWFTLPLSVPRSMSK
ncbi:HAMP domain-containing sensor histidine kinase [Oscillatoria sp. CS-180]|uniref:sensor histidine kinase n=1 Tax=Oscillatoria sp. CS-180 TaxID=3021720 RepID=UPI00232F1C47|nr:HAMP domain-containing sensor histidine kinase [Oscillatoria sp. CS-180]MDB9529176.1 HAMP domain-containing sensor histidine kinase [Oscillatoria sp. CS-180]